MTAAWSAAVRHAECDQQGIVFHGHYLTWADEAVTAWFASVGTPYPALPAAGVDLRVRASTLEWTRSARYGDLVQVDVACEHVGGTSARLVSRISTGSSLCCTVRTTYVVVDGDGRPVRVPDELRSAWAPVGG